MAEVAAPVNVVVKKKRFALLRDLSVRLAREKPLGLVGGIIVVILFFVGIFCDWLAPYGYNEFDLLYRLAPPSPEHILGCDNVGRDILSRIIYGARISMQVSVVASLIGVAGSGMIGIISGYIGGKFDLFLQRWVDAVQAFPGLVLYLTIMAIVGQGIWQVIFVLGISRAIGGGRIFRSAVLALKENTFVDAARVIGASNIRILIKHITPHIFPLIIISYSLSMGGMILAEASLSFLGFGIPPPYPSWGGMLSGAGREYMEVAPWMMLWPGLALFLVVYGVNMLGDAIRDLLDPRLRGGLGRYGGMNTEKLQKLIEKKSKKAATKA